jgi:hypothetical protein
MVTPTKKIEVRVVGVRPTHVAADVTNELDRNLVLLTLPIIGLSPVIGQGTPVTEQYSRVVRLE